MSETRVPERERGADGVRGRVRNNLFVQSAFGTVVWVVCGVGVVGAIAALLAGRTIWEDYGRNHLLRDSEQPRPSASGSAAGRLERDEEIRQLLGARNARRRRRGEPEIDVEQELARLTVPQIDDQLRSEIRDLVLARNHRRARRGNPPLHVETEIQREIAALGGISGPGSG